ncbi:MAG TPA: Xaa-Pro peptidase family protein [Tepidisphaeraceae bacterium]|jgi:Xaa-Pro dipeptidase|nr:Xaa-Pro peptidase family protein [Tepidisphaeraceae bacterium]
MLDPTLSRARQQRLMNVMMERRLDAVVVGLPHHVYYFSSHLTDWKHASAFVLMSDGRAVLVSANKPNEKAAADEPLSFEANWHSTLRQEQPATVAAVVMRRLEEAGRRYLKVGIDSSAVTSQFALQHTSGTIESIDAHLWQMRRKKDADELQLLRTAITATEAMYATARSIIEPGLPELDLFNALHAAAVKLTGEPLGGMLGNDYACGVGGGPARKDHVAQAGQLWVLDLGPNYRGYFADNSRVFAVDRKPTDVQLKAHAAVVGALAIVERMAKPGAKGREIYTAVDDHMKSAGYSGMTHHLGHGIGLQPHEYPHLNPKWDDTLLEGEVFTAEPGLYGGGINGGIRIENDYLVTSDGVQNLLNFSTDLV